MNPSEELKKVVDQTSAAIAIPQRVARIKATEAEESRRSEEIVLVRKLGKLNWENACRKCGRELHSGPLLCKRCAFAQEFPQFDALMEAKFGSSKPSIEDARIENLIRNLPEGAR